MVFLSRTRLGTNNEPHRQFIFTTTRSTSLRYLSLIAVAVLMSAFSACTETTSPNTTPTDTTLVSKSVSMVPDSANDYYFSFETNAAIPKANLTSSNWDMRINHAFGGGRTQQLDVLFNSGTVGTDGHTMAYVVDTTYDNVSVAESAKLRADSMSASGRIVSTALDGTSLFVYNPSTHIISTNPQKTIIVRTNNGSFYKVQLVSLTNPVSRYELSSFTFRYLKGSGTKLK